MCIGLICIILKWSDRRISCVTESGLSVLDIQCGRVQIKGMKTVYLTCSCLFVGLCLFGAHYTWFHKDLIVTILYRKLVSYDQSCDCFMNVILARLQLRSVQGREKLGP